MSVLRQMRYYTWPLDKTTPTLNNQYKGDISLPNSLLCLYIEISLKFYGGERFKK